MRASDTNDSVGQRCWADAIHAFGTGFVFGKRAERFQWRIRLLTFLGIAVPLTVGGIVASFGANPRALPYILSIAGGLAVVQLIGSAWSLVARWDDSLAYAKESMRDNARLSRQYRDLAEAAPNDIALRLEVLGVADRARADADLAQVITEREKRMGLRAGLRAFQRPCVSCSLVPQSMDASGCPVCGNF